MNRMTKNALLFLVSSFVIGFILLFLALFIYCNRTINDNYLTTTSLRNVLVLKSTLIHSLTLLPALIIFIYITTFSIFYTLSPFQSESFTYATVALPSFFFMLVLLFLTVFSEFFLIPKLHKDCEQVRYTSRTLHRAFSYAAELHKNNDSQKALNVLDVYLAQEKNDKKANKLHEEIMEKLFSTAEQPEHTPVVREKKPPVTATSYERGRAEYEKGNYYKALYYLERALSLHKDNLEIKELYTRTKQKVDSLLGQLTAKEKEAGRLIQQKEKAIEHLEKMEYYEAYEIFSELNRKYPKLYDLQLYLENAERELLKIDFLPEELKKIEWLPSFNNTIFFDKQGILNTVERIIPRNGGFYFYNIKRYKVRSISTEVEHWKYGKWIEGKIRLKNKDGFKKINQKDEDRYYIYPSVPPGYLLFITDREKLFNQLNLYERFILTPALAQSGVDIEDHYVFLSRKLGIFFSVWVLSLLLAGIAWVKRSIYEFPPFFKLLIFIVIAPVLSYFFYWLYVDINNIFIYSHRYVTRYIFKHMNIALYTALINAVIAFISTLFYLSQSSRVE